MVVDPTDPNKLLCVDEDPNTLMITRKRHTNFPRYPNYDFLQVEEINQILYNYTRKGFITTATVDTSLIFDELKKKDKYYNDNKSFDHVLYNFVDVSYEANPYVVKWTFVIRNRLWNGRFDIIPHDDSKSAYSYAIEKTSNGNTLIIKSMLNFKNNRKPPLKNFDLILHMSNADLPRNIRSVDVKYEGVRSVEHPYDQNSISDVKFFQRDKNGKFTKPLSGCIVQFVPLMDTMVDIKHETPMRAKPIPPTVAKEVRSGVYRVTFPKTTMPCKWHGKIQIYENSVEPDNLIIEQKISIVNQDIYTLKINFDENTTVKKGRINHLRGTVTRENYYGYSVPYRGNDLTVNIYHKYNKNNDNPLSAPAKNTIVTDVISAKVDEYGYFLFDIDGRGNYDDETKLTFSIGNLQKHQTSTPINRTLYHEWFIAENWDQLKTECEHECGADVIVLRNKYYSRRKDEQEIFINRESTNTQYILGRKGSGWATLNNGGMKFNFIVKPHKNKDDGMINKLIVKGVKFLGSSCAISQEEGTYVNVTACDFDRNMSRDDTNTGSCIYHNSTDCVTDIDHCYFDNNLSNLIVSRGVVNFTNSLVHVNLSRCVESDEPYICNVMSGVLNFKNNTVYINPFEETSLNLGKMDEYDVETMLKVNYGIYLFYIGNSGKINSKSYNQLKGNKTLLLNGNPDNNMIYIFLIVLDDIENKKVSVYYTRPSEYGNGFGHVREDDPIGYNDGFKVEKRASYINDRDYGNPFIYELQYPLHEKMRDPSIIVPSSGGVL